MIGFTHDGASRTTKNGISISMQSIDIVSSGFDFEVPGLDEAVAGFTLSMSIGTTCDFGTKNDSDSGLGLIDGFLRWDKAIPGGISRLDEPSLDRVSDASFSACGTW
jgi:hypothetical protein